VLFRLLAGRGWFFTPRATCGTPAARVAKGYSLHGRNRAESTAAATTTRNILRVVVAAAVF